MVTIVLLVTVNVDRESVSVNKVTCHHQIWRNVLVSWWLDCLLRIVLTLLTNKSQKILSSHIVCVNQFYTVRFHFTFKSHLIMSEIYAVFSEFSEWNFKYGQYHLMVRFHQGITLENLLSKILFKCQISSKDILRSPYCLH